MKPMNISHKMPEVAPSIGQYEMTFHTIQTRLKKQKEKCARDFVL